MSDDKVFMEVTDDEDLTDALAAILAIHGNAYIRINAQGKIIGVYSPKALTLRGEKYGPA